MAWMNINWLGNCHQSITPILTSLPVWTRSPREHAFRQSTNRLLWRGISWEHETSFFLTMSKFVASPELQECTHQGHSGYTVRETMFWTCTFGLVKAFTQLWHGLTHQEKNLVRVFQAKPTSFQWLRLTKVGCASELWQLITRKSECY